MRHNLGFWTNPWRPATDWFEFSPVYDVKRESDESARTYLPACEVDETKDHYLVTLDMPGMAKEDIKIEVNAGRLFISAERKQTKTSGDESARFSERRYGRFERIFELGEKVDPEKIEAIYRDGVLRVALAKAETAKPRSISVKTEDKGGVFEHLLETGKKPLN